MNPIPILIISLSFTAFLNGAICYYLGKKEGKRLYQLDQAIEESLNKKIETIVVSKEDVEKCRKQQLKNLKKMNKITYIPRRK